MFSYYCIFEAEITSISFINSFLYLTFVAGIGTPLFFFISSSGHFGTALPQLLLDHCS